MTNRLDTALQTLHSNRPKLSEGEQNAIAVFIEEAVSQDPIDPAELMTAEQVQELDRRLSHPVQPVDSAEINAFLEKHGVSSRY